MAQFLPVTMVALDRRLSDQKLLKGNGEGSTADPVGSKLQQVRTQSFCARSCAGNRESCAERFSLNAKNINYFIVQLYITTYAQ